MNTDTETLLANARYYLKRLEDLETVREDLEARRGRLAQEILDTERKIPFFEQAKEFFLAAVDEVYEASLGEMEKTLNAAVRFIFFDKDYRVKLDLDDRRGKCVDLYLVDNAYDPPMEVDMRDGVGNGVRSVVSFVLRVFRVVSEGLPPLLFDDEAYSAVSESYVDRFFTFARALCEQKGLALVLITHDERFLPYADRRYAVSDGRVTELPVEKGEAREPDS